MYLPWPRAISANIIGSKNYANRGDFTVNEVCATRKKKISNFTAEFEQGFHISNKYCIKHLIVLSDNQSESMDT